MTISLTYSPRGPHGHRRAIDRAGPGFSKTRRAPNLLVSDDYRVLHRIRHFHPRDRGVAIHGLLPALRCPVSECPGDDNQLRGEACVWPLCTGSWRNDRTVLLEHSAVGPSKGSSGSVGRKNSCEVANSAVVCNLVQLCQTVGCYRLSYVVRAHYEWAAPPPPRVVPPLI